MGKFFSKESLDELMKITNAEVGDSVFCHAENKRVERNNFFSKR